MSAASHPLRVLTPLELPLYADHLVRLPADDRARRFGATIDDDGVRAFVDRLSWRRTTIIGYHDCNRRLIGAVQVSACGENAVELAFSVDRDERGRGLGTELMGRALLLARNRGRDRVYVHTRADNRAMRRMLVAAGFAIERDEGEIIATRALPPWTPLSLIREAVAETAGWVDFTAKASPLAQPLPALARDSECASLRPA